MVPELRVAEGRKTRICFSFIRTDSVSEGLFLCLWPVENNSLLHCEWICAPDRGDGEGEGSQDAVRFNYTENKDGRSIPLRENH